MQETTATITDAMDRFYKSEKLNRPGGTRERLIADRTNGVSQYGADILASRHDSVTGEALWIKPQGDGFLVFSR